MALTPWGEKAMKIMEDNWDGCFVTGEHSKEVFFNRVMCQFSELFYSTYEHRASWHWMGALIESNIPQTLMDDMINHYMSSPNSKEFHTWWEAQVRKDLPKK